MMPMTIAYGTMNLPDMEHSESTNFLCPNCGSKKTPEFDFSISPDLSSPSPWSHVLQARVCADCGLLIPLHLAEMWNDMTASEAKEEWETLYKNGGG
jgi:acetone carboxylase gamma subunit